MPAIPRADCYRPTPLGRGQETVPQRGSQKVPAPVPTYTAPEPPVTFPDQGLPLPLPRQGDKETDARAKEEDAPVSPSPALPVSPSPSLPVPAEPEPSRWLKPLLWCNHWFDR